MERLLEVFKQVSKKYLIEMILIGIALVLAAVSFAIFLSSSVPAPESEEISFQKEKIGESGGKIYVEIAGAVLEPGVYELEGGRRMNDLLKLAGGLSEQADKAYFARNFNLAGSLQDQQKVYIPTVNEVTQGLFVEGQINQSSRPSNSLPTAEDAAGQINVNTASMSELDGLAGIGEVTAQKIIDNRPYQAIDELLNKKIVKQNVYEQIKDQITVN